MPHMEGIFINGEKAKFHPEDILDTDASQYTEEIGESVTAFLTEHITNPSNPPIDTSLSIAGAAADAKKTGDEISQLKSELIVINDSTIVTNVLNVNDVLVDQCCPLTVGQQIDSVVSRTSYVSTKPLTVLPGEKYIFNFQGYQTNIVFADSNKTIVSLNTKSKGEAFEIPSGVHYMVYSFTYNSVYTNYNQWKNWVMLIKGEALPLYYLPYGSIATASDTKEYPAIGNIAGKKKKAYVVLNFDAAENAETGFFTYRKSLLDGYGFKGCACLNPTVLNNSFDAWASDANRQQYFTLLKEGYDVALYTNQRGDSMTEAQWDSFLATTKSALEGIGVFNMVGYHCTGNNLTQDLFNALKKAHFKIVRCGGTNSFQPSFYAPVKLTDDTLIPICTVSVDANTVASNINTQIDNAIKSGTALAIMAHLVIDSSGTIDSWNCRTSTYTSILAHLKDKVDAGELEVVTWRELYAMMNPHDSMEYDYNRLLKMSIYA